MRSHHRQREITIREVTLELLMLRSVWTGPSDLHELVYQTIEAGFDGIEGPIPEDPQRRTQLQRLLSVHNLAFIAEVPTGSEPKSGAAKFWYGNGNW